MVSISVIFLMKYKFLYVKNFKQLLNSKKQKLAMNFFFFQSRGHAVEGTQNEI